MYADVGDSLYLTVDTFMVEDAVEAIGFGPFQWKLSILTGLSWVSLAFRCNRTFFAGSTSLDAKFHQSVPELLMFQVARVAAAFAFRLSLWKLEVNCGLMLNSPPPPSQYKRVAGTFETCFL